MIALMSIKPEYANKIFSGSKLFEFRKTGFAKPVTKVIVYSSSPQKKIIGCFSIREIIQDNPKNIWNKCKNAAGIRKQEFFKYYCNSKQAVCIAISEVIRFDKEYNPYDFWPDFTAPQSYRYLKQDEFETLLEVEPKLSGIIDSNSDLKACGSKSFS